MMHSASYYAKRLAGEFTAVVPVGDLPKAAISLDATMTGQDLQVLDDHNKARFGWYPCDYSGEGATPELSALTWDSETNRTSVHSDSVHCTDTPADMDIGVEEIRRWHTDPKPRGNGWRDVGYHFVIRRDGTVEPGRPLDEDQFITDDEVGAHARGFNQTHIGVAIVGGKEGFNFTRAQIDTLGNLLDFQIGAYGLTPADVIGHNEVSAKPCPQFDVRAFYD